jgi:rod shape determining protein RodA
MALRTITQKRGVDWITISLYLSLVIIGWLMLNAATYDVDNNLALFDLNTTIGKQTLWVGLSLVTFISVLVIDWKFWFSVSYFIYIGAIILLILVLLVGTEIKGAKSWFIIGSFSLQPAEFAKLGCCLALSSYLSFFNTKLKEFRYQLASFAIIFLPMMLILLQPDAGSAIVFLSFFILLFREGLNPLYLVVSLSLLLIFIFSLIFEPEAVLLAVLFVSSVIFYFNQSKKLAWIVALGFLALGSFYFYRSGFVVWTIGINAVVFLGFVIYMFLQRKTTLVTLMVGISILATSFAYGSRYLFENALERHQQDRINVWLRPSMCDPQGSLYNIIQSKLAIGSGGLEGKGYLKGTMTKYNYVPEQSTDFIFSIVGEEQGFIGSLGIILIFLFLLIRITIIAERAKNNFVRNYAYGLAGLIFFHFFINIGMTMGLMPVIGIPLPFLSKGGTSLLVFSIMMGILIKMDTARFRG